MTDITFEFACRDDCLDKLVPSDIRQLVAERDRLRAEIDATTAALKESRADEMQAIDYLNEIRDVIGGADYEHTVKIAADLKRMADEMEDQVPVAYVWTHHRTYGAPGEIKRKVIFCDEQGNDLYNVIEFYVNGGVNGEGKTISIEPMFSRPVPSVPDDTALLRQALEALNDAHYTIEQMQDDALRRRTIDALQERLK